MLEKGERSSKRHVYPNLETIWEQPGGGHKMDYKWITTSIFSLQNSIQTSNRINTNIGYNTEEL